MTREKVITLKTFDECSDELKEKILDRYRYINVDEWGEWISWDYVLEEMKKFGFILDEKDVNYDLSCCQGSGASFVCRDFVWDKLLPVDLPHKKFWIDYFISVSLKIVDKDGRYYHKYTKAFDTDWDKLSWVDSEKRFPYLSKEYDRLMERFEERRLKACDRLYDILWEDYEYLTSDEAVGETLLANEYYFNEQGEID